MSASSYESGIGRRDVLCSGGSALFSSLVAALLDGANPARAQTISGNVPEVDRATIRVVTDNYHFALSPSGKIGDVMVERIGFPLSDKPPEKVLLSEFGLSMHLETQRANDTRNVLIDFGYSSPTLLNNLDILGIDPAKLDAMVLSHGHYDHFGGMVGFLAATQGKRKPKLPLYIGGEECFCSRQFTAGPTPLNFGALDRKAIAEADLSVITAEGPAVIADHAFVTGRTANSRLVQCSEQSYSITSSARPSSVIGKVRPSAFAVLRLMTSSIFVTCCTGRSAGLSPLRMRPV
jgi:7,8-dihydropterin-6-yl-methyl-4-(beta-D-ribofuranosyl)aminobenzene 5'-phosphate synthase